MDVFLGDARVAPNPGLGHLDLEHSGIPQLDYLPLGKGCKDGLARGDAPLLARTAAGS